MRQPVRIVAHRNHSGHISVRLRCLVAGKYADIATGITLHPHEWDSRRLRVLTPHPDSKTLNARLDHLADLATQYLHTHPETASLDALRAALSDVPAAVDTYTSDDLFDALRAFIATESRRNTWSIGTVRRFQSLASALADFSPVLHLSTLSAATLDRFIDHRAARGFNNTTIGRDIHLIRWLLRWCFDNGRYHGNLHTSYTPHLKGANFEHKAVIFLTLDELHRLETTDLPPYYSAIRDVFVFCCYTGLRFSDAAALRRSDIHDGYIEVVTKKTGKRLRIELNRHSAAILDRYTSDLPPTYLRLTTDNPLALPTVSNQYTNAMLKAIGKLCLIDEPVHVVKYSGNRRIETTVPKHTLLTTHCARRTFVVTALQLGIPIEVITRWTGHSDLKAIKPYVAIVDDLKARNMAKFDTL